MKYFQFVHRPLFVTNNKTYFSIHKIGVHESMQLENARSTCKRGGGVVRTFSIAKLETSLFRDILG